MQRALKRLSPKDAYDRVFRMRRAFQVHLQTWQTTKIEDISNSMTVLSCSPASAQGGVDQA